MKVGITGTRHGMTEYQFNHIESFLKELIVLEPDAELHHGDCVGVDEEVATVAKELGYRIVCHPPEKNTLRAEAPSHEMRQPYNYFTRNRNIVDECDVLLVVPREMAPQTSGGTWYTYHYAQKRNKLSTVIYPGEKNEDQE
jgi:thiamine pyrophosphate-dependent acetolactate synthase large subunit-like protein